MTPWYTDSEIDDLCEGLHSNAAKCRHLRGLGLTVNQKPNGRPLVIRAQAEVVLAGLQKVQQEAAKSERNSPNRAALIQLFGSKKAIA